MLSRHGNGCTEALLVPHGFSRGLLAELILAGYATATTERMMAGGKVVEVRRLRITDAGRSAL